MYKNEYYNCDIKLSEYIKDCDNLSDRLNSAKFEIEDIICSVKDMSNSFDYNENELNEIEERLDLIKTLERKYGNTIADILYQKLDPRVKG